MASRSGTASATTSLTVARLNDTGVLGAYGTAKCTSFAVAPLDTPASAAKTPRGLGVRPQPPPAYHHVGPAAGATKSDGLLVSCPASF